MTTRLFVLLVALVGVAYWPASGAGFIWDDDDYVTDNLTLRSAEGLRQIWFEPGATPQYYPLVFSTFWVEHQLWGAAPAGYHCVNVLLHGFVAGLLFLVLRRLRVPGAWWAAALFAVHPVEVESVAWITERKNVLSAVFYLGSLLTFLRFSPPEPAGPSRGRWLWYVASLLLFAAALLSKTVTCSLPAVLVLILYWKRGQVTWRDILALAPMFALGAVLAWNTVRLETHLVGAQGEDWNFSFADRCLIAGRALWFYAGKLIWPHPLIFNYPRWHIDVSEPWQWLFPAAGLFVLLALFFLRNRVGRGPIVACLIFAGTLFPALGFFDVYPMIFSFVADHFQYLASAAFLTLAVATACQAGERWHVPADVGRVVGGALLLVLGCLTWGQCAVYENLETLWKDTLKKNPDSWLAHYNLGTRRLQQGLLDLAEDHFKRTIAIFPRWSWAHYNWGLVLARRENLAEAEVKFRTAVELDERHDLFHLNLGLARVALKKPGEALPSLRKAVALNPLNADANFRLGKLLLQMGQRREATGFLQRAVELRPEEQEFRQVLEEARK